MVKVLIKGPGNDLEIFIDGQKITGITRVDMYASAQEELPVVYLQIAATELDIDIDAELRDA